MPAARASRPRSRCAGGCCAPVCASSRWGFGQQRESCFLKERRGGCDAFNVGTVHSWPSFC
jgi:hypothetical protein